MSTLPATPFPFLQLATETRLPIYRLVLPYSEYDVEAQKDDCPVRWYVNFGACASYSGRLLELYEVFRD